MFKVYLCNTNSIGSRCGFGEGDTYEEAIADALRIAQRDHPEAVYNPHTRQVEFAYSVCL